MAQISKEFLDERVDLLADPLFKTKLLRLSDSEHLLLVGINHMVTNGASSGIVRREIATLYRLGRHELRRALPRPLAQFGDYAVWQQQTLEHWRSLHESYWRERFARTPSVEFPYDGVMPEHGALRSKMSQFVLGDCKKFCVRAG